MTFHMCTFDWLSLLAVSYDGVVHKIHRNGKFVSGCGAAH